MTAGLESEGQLMVEGAGEAREMSGIKKPNSQTGKHLR
jgi:hypothetical protein